MGAVVAEIAQPYCVCDFNEDQHDNVSYVLGPSFDAAISTVTRRRNGWRVPDKPDPTGKQQISGLKPETEVAIERHFRKYVYTDGIEDVASKDVQGHSRVVCPTGCFVLLYSHGLSDVYCLRPRSLGWGTFGDVALAVHTGTGARRAVKTINKTWLRRAFPHMQESGVNTFVRREVEVLKRLDHPNIVRLYEAFDDANDFQVVLELCQGGTLTSRIKLQQRGSLESDACSLFRQMLAAVQHLHSHGFIHRDLKPDNFMFAKTGLEDAPFSSETMCLKLIDFGLARRLGVDSGLHNQKLGTKDFFAPELFGGQPVLELSDRIDMWALGVILFLIFTGELPPTDASEKLRDEAAIVAMSLGRVSTFGIDLLSQLLGKEPLWRPTALMAMRHGWCSGNPERCQLNLWSPVGFAPVVKEYVLSPKLRRLALLSLAYVADDHDIDFVIARRYFQVLEFESEGAVTRASLRVLCNAEGCVGTMAASLHAHFDELDIDGAGAVTWTKFLAIFIKVRSHMSSKASDLACDVPGIVISEEICRRAFYLLSDGTDKISAVTIGELFSPISSGRVLNYDTRAKTSRKFQGLSQSMARDDMIREVDSKGCLHFDCFMRMLSDSGQKTAGFEIASPRVHQAVTSTDNEIEASTSDTLTAINAEMEKGEEVQNFDAASDLDGEYAPVTKSIATKPFTIDGNQWIFAGTGNVYTITDKTNAYVRRSGYNGFYNYKNGMLIRDDGFAWKKVQVGDEQL